MFYKLILTNLFFSLILVFVLILNDVSANADSIEVSDAWASESLVGGRPSAVYLTITNNTPSPITLIGAETKISKKVQIHETYTKNNITKMRPISKITIASSTNFKFRPGGFHFMLTSLNQSLRSKQVFPLILFFEESEKLSVYVHVAKHSGHVTKKNHDHHEH